MPAAKPAVVNFSSGPCAKRPGWTPEALKAAALGRSHRAKIGKTQARTGDRADAREFSACQPTIAIGIVPASDTGAVEMALWSLLGARGVDIARLGILRLRMGHRMSSRLAHAHKDARIFKAGYGRSRRSSPRRRQDALRCLHLERHHLWRAAVPDADWIPADREGLTICDATSAAFAHRASIGPSSMSSPSPGRRYWAEKPAPRHADRVATGCGSAWKPMPAWPLPKIFRLTKAASSSMASSRAKHRHPSMLCVEDYLDQLGQGRRRP